MKKNEIYLAPVLECYNSVVEQGFAVSTNVEDPTTNPEMSW